LRRRPFRAVGREPPQHRWPFGKSHFSYRTSAVHAPDLLQPPCLRVGPRSGGRLAAVLTGVPARVLEVLGLQPDRITALKDVPLQNGSWLLEMQNEKCLVLRRYHARAARQDLSYEHSVLRYLARAGWIVSAPVGELVQFEGLWYCPTRPRRTDHHQSPPRA
jgi:hypothetical protein